jgi:hypothetical protein
MRTKRILIGLVVVIVLAVIVGFVAVARIFPTDPAAAPELSLPPPLLTAEQLGGRQLLFDGETTKGWKIEGPHQIKDATLELGGTELAKATLERTVESGEQIEFHFFQEGTAGAKLSIKRTFIDPKDQYAEYLRDLSSRLNLSSLIYRRWHAATTWFIDEHHHNDIYVEYHPVHGHFGQDVDNHDGIPCVAGCRYQVVFEVAPHAKLYLRNIVISKHAKHARG